MNRKPLNLLVILMLLFGSWTSMAQNQGYQILHDSIYPLMDSDYTRAKALIIKYESIIDPQELLLLLDDILEQDDLGFYKDRAQFLMINYGLNYSEIDLIESRMIPANLQAQFSKNHLTQWMFDASEKHYPLWIKNNTKSVWFQEKIAALKLADQTIRGISLVSDDSNCKEQLYRNLNEIDFNHLLKLVELCQLNDDKMLNHFDNGVKIYYRLMGSVIWHNLKIKTNCQKSWELLLPYIEKAYFEEKIDFQIFKLYDQACQYHSGYQYYGTLADSIPIHDLENYEQRRKKYHLEDFSLEP